MKHEDPAPPPSRRLVLAGLAGVALVGCRDEPSPRASTPPEQATTQPLAQVDLLRIEVVHDTVCPWCRIGCHNLHAAIDTLGPRAVEVVYQPYLLDPDTPPGGADLRERLGKKYGPERVEGMFASVTQAGAKYGVRFDFDRVRVTPQTTPSHALIAWAPAGQRRALVEAIHLAYFERGENIGDPAVLAAIARGVGLDAGAAQATARDASLLASVRQQATASQLRGVRGVPHFVIGRRELHGAQAPEALRDAMLGA